MPVTVDDLARATRNLRSHPTDYGAWLEVAALLGALGHADDAEAAFAAVGEGARAGGRVALAVACGRHLEKLGSLRGGELIDQVIETYATGGPHFHLVKPAPLDKPDIDLTNAGGTPLADARTVIKALGPWLAGREPGVVPPAPLLSALSKPGARALVGVMTARAYPAGKTIIEAGEPATALYWLAHGNATVIRGGAQPAQPAKPLPPAKADISGPNKQLGELHSGAFFGEIALVGGTTRTASVIANDDVWVLEIPAKAVENAAQKHPKLAEVLAFHARARLLANLTRTSELFKALTDRDAVIAKLTTEIVPAGTKFITEGAANEFLWVIVAGKVEVRGADSVVAELGPGAAVGEISLVSGDPAVADVIAVEQAVVLKLAKRDFDEVAKKQPKLLETVEKLVIAREKQNRALFQDASDLIV
ncbi:MAG: cyclic nucleotide-binding domain-containing protein [Deltaproteobacteria bacterium]